jgi:hypothetical protein
MRLKESVKVNRDEFEAQLLKAIENIKGEISRRDAAALEAIKQCQSLNDVREALSRSANGYLHTMLEQYTEAHDYLCFSHQKDVEIDQPMYKHFYKGAVWPESC